MTSKEIIQNESLESNNEKKEDVSKTLKISDVKLPTPVEMGFSDLSDLDISGELEEGDSDSDPIKEGVLEKKNIVPDYSDVEKKAMQHGWMPKDKFEGEEGEFRSAEYFMGKGEMLDKFSNQSKKVKRLESAIKNMTVVFQKNIEDGKRRDIEGLVDKRNEAITDQDIDAVNKIDTQISEIHKNHQDFNTNNQEDMPPGISPEVASFAEDNQDWFNGTTPFNQMMMNKAVEIDAGINRHNPNLSITDRLKQTKDRMTQLFPDYFVNGSNAVNSVQKEVSKRTVEQPFETVSQNRSTNKPNVTQKISFKNCPSEVRQVINQMYQYNTNKSITKDEYAQTYIDNLIAKGLLVIQ